MAVVFAMARRVLQRQVGLADTARPADRQTERAILSGIEWCRNLLQFRLPSGEVRIACMGHHPELLLSSAKRRENYLLASCHRFVALFLHRHTIHFSGDGIYSTHQYSTYSLVGVRGHAHKQSRTPTRAERGPDTLRCQLFHQARDKRAFGLAAGSFDGKRHDLLEFTTILSDQPGDEGTQLAFAHIDSLEIGLQDISLALLFVYQVCTVGLLIHLNRLVALLDLHFQHFIAISFGQFPAML